jgi:hypothetical protein
VTLVLSDKLRHATVTEYRSLCWIGRKNPNIETSPYSAHYRHDQHRLPTFAGLSRIKLSASPVGGGVAVRLGLRKVMSGGRPTEGRQTGILGHELPDIAYLSTNKAMDASLRGWTASHKDFCGRDSTCGPSVACVPSRRF